MYKLLIFILLVLPIINIDAMKGRTLWTKVNESALPKPVPFPLTPQQVGKLALRKESDEQNIWELSGQTEGDMVLRPQQRTGKILLHDYKWKDKVIPYDISSVFTEEQANIIHEAVKEFREKSCLTVRPRTTDDVDYVNITAENIGCWSNVGRLGGNQTINLQIDGCLTKQIIIHEFLHTAGFRHQHSTNDRDFYIGIIWDNVQKGDEENFEKYGPGMVNEFGAPYDYGSIMHYSEKAFSADGKPTIVPLNVSWVGKLGIAQEMSTVDAVKLNEMYCEYNQSSQIWMYVGISLAVVICISTIVGILSWCYCLTCCVCKSCCCCR